LQNNFDVSAGGI